MDSDRMSDFRERGSIFKQMAEMKKKIQLVTNLFSLSR
jgi:hypothetical protein